MEKCLGFLLSVHLLSISAFNYRVFILKPAECLNKKCLSFFLAAIFERLRNVLHESSIDKRVQYMIEVMFAIRKDGFKDHPVIPEGLDLVDEDDQFTHMLPLDDEYNPEDILSKMKRKRQA